MEKLKSSEAAVNAPGSDRNFGLVFAAFFALVGLLPLVHGGAPRLWAFAVGALFLAIALAVPRLLAPLNYLWFRFGLLLHAIVSPIAMGIIFFGAIWPMGWVMRAMGKRPLNLAIDRQAKSYWIVRQPPGPDPKTMSDPF